MNKLWIFTILPLALLYSGKPKEAKKTFDGKAYKTSEVMDFTDSSQKEIDDYYHIDTLKSESGDELKESLYQILSTDSYAVTYNQAFEWYKITDRNWELSRTIDPSTYLFAEDTGNNYFEVMMYFEYSANQDPTKAINRDVNGFKIVKDRDSGGRIDWKEKINHQEKDGPYINVDREHVWAKDHGFKVDDKTGTDVVPNAGTDLHHLVAADHNTNSAGHSNEYYGEVVDKTAADSKTIYCYYADGTKAISGWRGKSKYGETVFEPTDEWKGDVARALMYMATRYGHEEEYNTKAEPYLALTDDATIIDNVGKDCIADKYFHGVHHSLSTLLEWNRLDPVSTYEAHRNNLIYKNVQKNRNPYIDYSGLAERVFTSSATAPITPIVPVQEGASDYSKLKTNYSAYVDQKVDLGIKIKDVSKVSVEFNKEIISLSSDYTSITGLKSGETDLTFTETLDDDSTKTYTTKIQIKAKPEIHLTSLDSDQEITGTTIELEEGDSLNLKLGSLDLFNGDQLSFVSEDEEVATVENNTIKANRNGKARIHILLKTENGTITLGYVDVNVSISKTKRYIMIALGALVLLILILVFMITMVRKTKKKSKAKNSKKMAYNNNSRSKSSRTTASKSNSMKAGSASQTRRKK